MIRRISATAFLLLLAGPLAAQTLPPGVRLREDYSASAADPDDVLEVMIVITNRGFQVNTGPAAVVWNPFSTAATGTYNLKGTFTLLGPSDHVNFYGLVFGGRELERAGQSYLSFLVAQNGTFLIRRRAGDATTHDVLGPTPHAAVVQPDATGMSINALEVRVGADQIAYFVNGTQVRTTPKTEMTDSTDGIWGVRIDHRLPGVLVEGLSNAPKHRRLHRALWTAAGAAAIYGGYLLARDESGSSGVYRTIDVATGREATVTGFRSFKQAAGSGLMLVGTVSILITWDLF